MAAETEVTIQQDGQQYGATFSIRNGMLDVKTHTETRSVELKGEDPASLARRVLAEIVSEQPNR